jgi:Flp pilus assembly protein TadB
MNKKSLFILEIVWISVGIICIAAGIRSAFTNGGSRVFIFIIMALVSFGFAWLRHRQRKKS